MLCIAENAMRCKRREQGVEEKHSVEGALSRRQVLCIAENAIGPLAFRNDDILRCYSGKWVAPHAQALAKERTRV